MGVHDSSGQFYCYEKLKRLRALRRGSMYCPQASSMAISTLRSVMHPFSHPSTKPAYPKVQLVTRFPAYCRLRFGPRPRYLFIPTTTLSCSLGIESFRIYVSDILHPDAQRAVEDPRWLICVFANGSPRVENAGYTPERVEAHPNGTVISTNPQHLPSRKHALSYSILPPLLGP
ncbi:hypothetical protein BKA70DRAFT_1302718 [Coprinopsis sp. MPI-PUGE-AT-0042]|nr:hypothetical protein BKA70DRAFT_1302718 [Coprinopsis sp. MPI-PUGE-AT-0042]